MRGGQIELYCLFVLLNAVDPRVLLQLLDQGRGNMRGFYDNFFFMGYPFPQLAFSSAGNDMAFVHNRYPVAYGRYLLHVMARVDDG
ncbi:hypothetical protein D3C85_1598040 [compost metagenome]